MSLAKASLLAAVVLLSAARESDGAEPGRKALKGHVPQVIAGLTPVGTLAATNQLYLAIGLPLRNTNELEQFLHDVSDPASPNFRKFLTPEEFTARFGPTEADYEAVKNFARTNGLKITGTPANRLLLDVTGSASSVEQAFHVTLRTYHHPTEQRDFFAPDTEPEVDAALPIVDVSGLDNYSRPHPRIHPASMRAKPNNGSAPDGSSLLGNDFRNAYAPGVTLTGAGQSVGLFQADGFYASDIAAYAQQAGGGRTNIVLQTVLIDGFGGTPTTGANSGNGEVSLDIEMSMSMAPGLTRIILFEGNPTNGFFSPVDILNTMAASNTVKNLSSSWGWSGGPSGSTDNIFKTMAAQGQTYFNAAGDSDAFTVGSGSVNGVDNPSLDGTPSSSPYITQVGGTTLTMNGTGASYASETVWNWGYDSNARAYVGTSGGVSSYYSIPSWQTGINMAANQGSTNNRNIPDVALTADQVYVYYGNGSTAVFGGTSCAAPLWAGFMSLINQQVVLNTGKATNSVGFINPAIYAIGNGSNAAASYGACFHDTTTGNNYSSSSPANYAAVTGYDLCTGWGTPNGMALITALAGAADPLGVIPATGFTITGYTGGSFSPTSQNYTLTNSGAATLNWSVISTSVWLNVSASSGSLIAGAQTGVTVSVNSSANSLAAGNYSSTVVFSNQTSGVAQHYQVSLQISEPLVLLASNGFAATGAAGGPFTPGSQSLVFTNLSAGAVPWSLINTAAWLSVSSTSGSLAGDSSLSVTVATNLSTVALALGTYNASLLLSNQVSGVVQHYPVSLQVSEPLLLLTTNVFTVSGSSGGPFVPGSQSLVFTNLSAGAVPWSLINTAAWLSVSSTSGSLGGDSSLSVTVSTNSSTLALPFGTYTASLLLSNQTSGVAQRYQVSLQIFDPLALLTTNGFTAGGPPGGPFASSSQSVMFTNLSAGAVPWSLINTAAWVSVSSVSGSLPGNTAMSVTISTNASTAALPVGTYNASLLLSNQTSHLVHNLALSALVGVNIVVNGGFETGDVTGWSVSGSSGTLSPTTSPQYVHSGTYGLQATCNTLDDLTQNLITVPGQTYQLSFSFLVSSAHSGQQFEANWNGTTVYNTTSLPTGWTTPTFIVTATSGTTQLQFGLNSGTSSHSRSIGLDDISVVPVNLPAITQQPVSQTNLAGGNVMFTVAATGTAPLGFQWFTNGVGLANAGNVSGVTSNVLSLAAVTTGNAGNYTIVITNAYGAVTSSVATLAVVLPPSLGGSSLTNRTLQCDLNTNTFTVAAGGTAPLSIQWTLDTTPIAGATNSTFSLTNLSMPNHTVGVVVTNLYGSLASNAVLTVVDTLPPVITLNGAAVMTNELGSAFIDPGATAYDACAGSVPVATNGTVNVNAVSTNVIIYRAGDGNGNTNSATRTVYVHDTTPPTILWCFTNLVVGANSNCVALMTNVTGTNFIRAADLSGTVIITQVPTNNAALPIGTNIVVMTAADPSGNKSYSTNQIVVTNQTLPQIVLQPLSQTNVVGATVSFSSGATACTPLAYLWYSNNIALPAQTNVTLTLASLTTNANGSYFAVASASSGASTSQVATLLVNVPPPGFGGVAASINGGFTLNLTGSPGYTYVLLSASNLGAPWLPLATNTLGTNGTWQFTDFGISNNPDQFYRLMQQ